MVVPWIFKICPVESGVGSGSATQSLQYSHKKSDNEHVTQVVFNDLAKYMTGLLQNVP